MTAPAKRALGWAAATTLLVLAWQLLTVHFNYRGDWSGLFYTGQYVRLPADIAAERPFRIAHDPGYDGQFYHLIAHDPFFREGYAGYVDNPRLRWRRILLPLMAWTMSLGNGEYVDGNYAMAILLCVFLGAFWLGLYAIAMRAPPACALGFALAPATLTSIDRFTVDVALAALCVGFVVEEGWKLWLILALAPLARETGVTLPVAYGLICWMQGDRRRAALTGLTILPFGVWLLFVARHTAPDATVFAGVMPLRGLVERTLHPMPANIAASQWIRTAAMLDYLGVLGMWLVVALAVWLGIRKQRSRAAVAAVLFTAVFVIFVAQPQVWEGAYSFSRTMSPALLFLGLIGLGRVQWIWFLPLACVLPRLLFQLSPQWKAILRGLVHR